MFYTLLKLHLLRLNITPGKRLRQQLKGEKAYRKEPSAPRPYIESLSHFEPQQPLHHVRPGMLLSLSGHHLKVDPQSEDEGVYLMADRQRVWKVAQLITNVPSQLVFLLPAELPTGQCRLQVRCRVGGSTELRQDTYRESIYCKVSAASEWQFRTLRNQISQCALFYFAACEMLKSLLG